MIETGNDEYTFKHIDLGEFTIRTYDSGPLREIEFLVRNMVESAVHCFRGYFPTESPCWPHDFSELPWRHEYSSDSGQHLGLPISMDDVRPYLYSFDDCEQEPPTERLATARCGLSRKEYVQGIAVEMLMFADACITCLEEEDNLEAMRYMSAMYLDLFDITSVVSRMDQNIWRSADPHVLGVTLSERPAEIK